ncbi:hypothetical protein OOK29_26105 [Streptomyces phaeochromogenes]|uniref:hypothetical protein n=1 Tax=Streptomyces phaeochromogenes TaxID=1923 RepID=UPI0022524528|nr:hypothetical protein [Streptomyces phaeochromogenes]MCX5601629.1 hypothetical protein [Streptomyces phaeochromogenes]
MPRSIFMGRVPGPGEPLWLAEDRAWALALLEVEADACGDCGQPRSETADEKNEFAYTAELMRCHACAASAREVRRYQDKGGQMDGLQIHIEKRH